MLLFLCLLACALSQVPVVPFPSFSGNFTGTLRFSSGGAYKLWGFAAWSNSPDASRKGYSETNAVAGVSHTVRVVSANKSDAWSTSTRHPCTHETSTVDANNVKACNTYKWDSSVYFGQACYEGSARCVINDEGAGISTFDTILFVSLDNKTLLASSQVVVSGNFSLQIDLEFTAVSLAPVDQNLFKIPSDCPSTLLKSATSPCPKICDTLESGCDAKCTPRIVNRGKCPDACSWIPNGCDSNCRPNKIINMNENCPDFCSWVPNGCDGACRPNKFNGVETAEAIFDFENCDCSWWPAGCDSKCRPNKINEFNVCSSVCDQIGCDSNCQPKGRR